MDLISVSEIGAIYAAPHILIYGVVPWKPSPLYQVGVALYKSNPPQYGLFWIIPDGQVIQLAEPNQPFVVAVAGPYQETITVHTQEGSQEVEVQSVVPLAKTVAGANSEEGENSASSEKGDRDPVSFGFEKGDRDPIPFRLTGLGGGDPKVKFANVREAIGYSQKFSFEEAFLNAINNLPQLPPEETYPDQLFNVQVTGVGALYGGIVGYTGQLYVKVRG